MKENIQHAIELFNTMQKKKEELKEVKKAFKNLHKEIMNAKITEFQKRYPEINTINYIPWANMSIMFRMSNGIFYDLIMHSSEKKIECTLAVAPETFKTHSKVKSGELSIDTKVYDKFIDWNVFRGIFSLHGGNQIFLSRFLTYQYDEAFDCFAKAYEKLVELGAEIVNYQDYKDV